jgi:hypothetical protein
LQRGHCILTIYPYNECEGGLKKDRGETKCPFMNLNVTNVGMALKNWYSPLMMRGPLNAPLVERKMFPDYCLLLHADHPILVRVSKAPHQLVVPRQAGFPERLRWEQP